MEYKLTKKEKKMCDEYISLYTKTMETSNEIMNVTMNQIKELEEFRLELYKSRPHKIFFKTYKEWETMSKNIDAEIMKMYCNLEEELNFRESIKEI